MAKQPVRKAETLDALTPDPSPKGEGEKTGTPHPMPLSVHGEGSQSSEESLPTSSPLPAQLRLLHDYRGSRTGERIIAEGIYDVDDPALMGLADYLVTNGHARVLP